MPLYVILHGLTVVRPRANEIEVVLPRIPGHVYRTGNWHAETSIAPKSVLRLQGVTAGRAAFPWDGMIYLPDAVLTSRKRAATIWLPNPDHVLGLACATLTSLPFSPTTQPPTNLAFVAKTSDDKYKFTKVATAHVLIYDNYASENDVLLEGHYWEPRPTGGAISLHIISTSEEPEGKAHEDATDNVMQHVLRNYPGLTFREPRALAAPWMDPDYRDYGDLQGLIQIDQKHGNQFVRTGNIAYAFALEELEPFTSRVVRLGRLGGIIRSTRSIQSLWKDAAPLSDRTSNCPTMGTTH